MTRRDGTKLRWRIGMCSTMWPVVAALSSLAGCSSNECDGLQPLIAPSTASEPGTLQAAFLEPDGSQGAVAVRSDGAVLCFVCDTVTMLDGAVHEAGHFPAEDVVHVAVAPDDAIYFLRPGRAMLTSELVALSPNGEPRWTMPVDGPPDPLEIFAGREGPYVGLTSAAYQPIGILGFDAATGEQRTLLTGDSKLLGAANGGVIISERTDVGVTTIRQLDAAGARRWSHAIHMTQGHTGFSGAVGTPEGGAIYFENVASSVDFGDLALDSPYARSIAAGFDATGATQFAFTVNEYWITHVALTPHGEILLGGQTDQYYFMPADSFLAVASPAGITRTLRLDGGEDQVIAAMSPDADGAVWLQVKSQEADDNTPPPVLQVADQAFEGRGNYLLKIVP